MDVPIEISYDGVPKTPKLDSFIRGLAEKLDRYHPHITSCRVSVSKPHERHKHVNPFQVRVLVKVPPGHDLVSVRKPVDSKPLDPLTTVIRSAFDAVERQVKDMAARQRGAVKHHEEPRAFVARLFEEAGYGFLRTKSDREIYFHRNAVINDEFPRLAVGTEVRFEETMGEQGPQATTVQIVAKPGESEGVEESVVAS